MSLPWILLPADKKRIYYNICMIKFLLNIISPGNDMLDKIKKLFVFFPEIDQKALGFPTGWETEPLWNS